MDYSSSWVDTSLDLNINPRQRIGVKKDFVTNFMDLGNKQEVQSSGALLEELKRVSAENKKLTEMLTVMCENYNALKTQLVDYMNKNRDKEPSPSRKRKSESSNTNTNNNTIPMTGNSESSSTDEESCKKPREEVIKAKISRVYVKSEPSDTTLVVKDGYQWRKYGQKVTRDNPSPRAYFKCSFAPACPVKKKVQRSIEDQSVLVATYEGEHNHPHPSQMETTSGGSRSLTLGSVPCSASLGSSGPTITLDLTKSKSNIDATNSKPRTETPQVRQFLVEQMASSLTKDPTFTAALAAAISGRMLQQNHTEKW
ncbi:probable WRKY transcription factor 40 [Euphorbia lathyris]|uniref:probable WRKY transcription factor 40 n=1 Tax=Euphorbia lathyris TaxID=212925 RepID=UPI003313DACD